MLCFGHNSVIASAHWHPTSLKTYQVNTIVHIRTWCAPGRLLLTWQKHHLVTKWHKTAPLDGRDGEYTERCAGKLSTRLTRYNTGLGGASLHCHLNHHYFFMFHLFVALFGLQIKRLPRWFKTPSHRCVNFLLLVPTVQHSLGTTSMARSSLHYRHVNRWSARRPWNS